MKSKQNYLSHEALALRYVLSGGAEISEIFDALSPSSKMAASQLNEWLEQYPHASALDFLESSKQSTAFSQLLDFHNPSISFDTQKQSFDIVKTQKHSSEIRKQQALIALQEDRVDEARQWLDTDHQLPSQSAHSLIDELRQIQANATKEQIHCTSQEGILLDPQRGSFALWLNACLGPRGALEAGKTLLIGGAPGGGKTSLASALAVDSLNQNVPVLLWQMELSRSEQIEHLAAQVPTFENKSFATLAMTAWRTRIKSKDTEKSFENWNALLKLPATDESRLYSAEWIAEQMRNMARKCIKLRKENRYSHKVNGLCVIDYVQLIQSESLVKSSNRHEVLERATNLLVKTAADFGLVLILCSQLNKDRDDTGAKDTSFAGADLVRMAHTAITMVPNKDEQNESSDQVKVVLQKHRGTLDGSRSRFDSLTVQSKNRLLVHEQHYVPAPPKAAPAKSAKSPKATAKTKTLSSASEWLSDLDD